MRRRDGLFDQPFGQGLRRVTVLHIQQKFDVPFGSLNGRKIQPRRCKMVGDGISLCHFQHFPMGGRVAHDTLFPDFFPARFKLRPGQRIAVTTAPDRLQLITFQDSEQFCAIENKLMRR